MSSKLLIAARPKPLNVDAQVFKAIVESVIDYAIFVLDPDGFVVTWNPGAERIKGYRADEIIGQHFSVFYEDEPVARGWPDHELRVAAADCRFEDEGWRVRKDGSRFWANVVITAIRENGELRGFAKITRDLTQRRRVEMLEAEGRRVAEFIAMLAHELRNPLAPIRNAIGVMRAAGDDALALMRCRDVIDRQLAHLTRLVDDLLDAGRITSGKIKLERASVEVAVLLQRAVEASRAAVDAKHHTLFVSVPAGRLRVDGDATRLVQALVNIINNAIKYTNEGGRIDVSAQRDDDAVEFRVVDNGVGISPPLLDRLFDLFVQGERTLDRSEGGLGIGLTLVRRIAELHGGTVHAASEGPGQGSTFSLRLPLSAGDEGALAPVAAAAIPAKLASQRILVVDDNVDSAETMAILLRLNGHDVRTAHDGLGALREIEARTVDTVLLDIGLPGLNGYEVARRLRVSADGTRLRLVALSGYGHAEARALAQDVGFDAYLVKPVSEPELYAALETPRAQPSDR